MVSTSTSRMEPTYFGYIGSTKDALLIIQGVLNNQLLPVPRRPHDRERNDLIKSGSVFVFVEEKSGIKRWTDGVAWSPSRILGRFLVYRELDRQAVNNIKGDNSKPGSTNAANQPIRSTDKKLLSKTRRSFESLRPSSTATIGSTANYTEENTETNTSNPSSVPNATSLNSFNASYSEQNSNTVSNRSLVGSLIASYAFKEFGLIKKTLSLTVQRGGEATSSYLGQQPQSVSVETFHLVSYYSADDVLTGRLVRPVDSQNLKDLQLSTEVCNAVKESSLGGKIPIEDESYYSIDESNPNAIALGFNPGMHYPPQYQQAQSSQTQNSQTQQPQVSHQLLNQQIPSQLAHQQPQLGGGIIYGHPFPQYSQPPSQQQLAHQISPHLQQQQPQQNRVAGPNQHHHQPSASYSLPLPINNNNGGLQQIEYFGDLNASMQYQQPQQQQPPPQYRFTSNQGFIPSSSMSNASYSFLSQHQPAPHPNFPQPNSSANSFSHPRAISPSSPTKPKNEHSPLTIHPGSNFGPNTSLSLSSITPRDNHQNSISGGSSIPDPSPNQTGINHNGSIGNQGLGLASNVGGNLPGANPGGNGRWYYDENSGHIQGPYVTGFQHYGGPQNS